MMMYFVFSLTFLVALILIFFIRYNAPYLGLMDIPNARSVHKFCMPRGAGIGFFLAAILILSYFYTEVVYHFMWVNIALWAVFLWVFGTTIMRVILM